MRFGVAGSPVEPGASGMGFSVRAKPAICQLESGQYCNPQMLKPGAVRVVGSGQSGGQIAEELNQAGRKVYLCTGSAGHAPRRYRGRDLYEKKPHGLVRLL